MTSSDPIRHLREIVARLRAPGGCPWDREQTHTSLRNDLLEEAHEVIEAIDKKDDAHFCEELGDLLLQVVMHSQMAAEENRFTFDEVALGIGEKLIRRHPHVFGDNKLGDTEVEIEFEIPKDFSGETLNFTVTTPGGTSEIYKLPVAKALQNEKEPNDSFEKAEELKLPARIEGTIGREKDLDLFRFNGKKGQLVKIDLFAARLGSPADLILTIYDGQKQTLKIIDDVEGNPDPRCEFQCPADGVYFLAVMEANDLGGAMFGYRLRVD